MVRYFTLYILLLVGLYGHSQLSDFTLTVTVTDETCFGNGSLAFSVSDTEPGATIIYEVYKLPDTTTPITTSTGNPVIGLNSGVYQVVAIQSLGGNIGSQTAEVVIADLTDPLTFLVESSIVCPDEGIITVNVLTGTAVTYQIISGPNDFSTPPQTSNVFTGLQPGLYLIGVQDAGPCGDFFTQNNQIVYTPPTPILFSGRMLTANLNSCDGENTVTAQHALVDNIYIYPLTITFTTYPPDGSTPVVQTQVISGNIFNENIPFYEGEYFYDITIIDGCGNSYSLADLPVNFSLNLEADYDRNTCYSMILTVSNFIESYTLEFISHPEGFDPEIFNTNHPGPFTDYFILYGVDATGEFIVGNYQVIVTDACGRTTTIPFTIQLPDVDPILDFFVDPPAPPDCNCTGRLFVAHTFGLASATILDAPDEYLDFLEDNNLSLPHDVSDFIRNPPLNFLMSAPTYGCGEYTVMVTDVCGNEFILTKEMEPWNISTEDSLSAIQAPGCDGFGSLRIMSSMTEDIIGKIEAAHILSAPDEFYQLFNATPSEIYDITDYAYSISGINDGPPTWYIGINGLPEGEYKFNIQFACEFIPFTYFVEAYQQTTTLELEEMCGAFNFLFNHTANNSDYFVPKETFWLERYNEVTEEWEYMNEVRPNEMNYNIPYFGNFRIVKQYSIWNNGTAIPPEFTTAYCIESIDEFEFTGHPHINGVAYFPCPNGENEIFVDANGVPPLVYEITEKNNQPFYINNGESNFFTNLEQGIYNFRVTDSCGNTVNGTYHVNQPFDFDIIATPLCNGLQGSLYTHYFSFLNYQWWHSTNPNDILSTNNQLFFDPFNAAQDSGTYYLNISYLGNPNSCVNQTLSYQINITPPHAGDDQTIVYCSSSEENVDLFSFFTSEYDDFGVWEDLSQTGALQDSILTITNLLPGTYEFGYNVNTCEGADQSVLTLVLVAPPSTPIIVGADSVCIGFTIQLDIENPNPHYIYTWTHPNGTVHIGESISIPEIDAEDSGLYMVTASVAPNHPNNCIANASINIHSNYCELPKGLSPNGDGLNDFFDLSDFNVEKLKIFNRYGRMVYEAKNGYINEWYGQSSVNNNKLLPTATYYYVVTFGNGNIKTGWVYLSRED